MKIAACILTFLVALSVSALADQPAPVQDFQKRVADYLQLRKTACERVPPLKKQAEPEEIAGNKRAQADAIRGKRQNAAQGDIITPPTAEYLKTVIRAYMSGPGRQPAKEAVKQGNPADEGGAKVPLRVNATYPDSAPLSTVPPGLLLKLPELPKEVDYRFVGPHLVLHDAQAGIIIDFLPNAMK